MALFHVDFFSKELGMCTNMEVIIPQENKNKLTGKDNKCNEELPVLYLLHGMSDDHTIWSRRTSIERYAEEIGIAIVMPKVELSWYANTIYGMKYWNFISEELPDLCQTFFPQLSKKRQFNMVAGLSMGGYGAFKCKRKKITVYIFRDIYDKLNPVEKNI